MTEFIIKDWANAPPGWNPQTDPLPPGATPLSAEDLEELEGRVHDAIEELDIALRQIGASSEIDDYTFVAEDVGTVVEFNSTNNLIATMPAGVFQVGEWVEVYVRGPGAVTIAGAVGVTLESPNDILVFPRNTTIWLRQRAANIWVVTPSTIIPAASAFDQEVLFDKPLVYWLADDRSGPLAHDVSGNRRHGTIMGLPVRGVPGLTFDGKRAMQFAGAPAGVSQYITFAQSGPLDVTTAVTVGAVVQREEPYNGLHQGIISRHEINLRLDPTAGPKLIFEINAGGNHSIVAPDIFTENPALVHGTYDGTIMRLYVNGVEVINEAHSVGGPMAGQGASRPLEGANHTGSLFYGTAQKFMFFDHVLSAERIAAQYRASAL